MLATRRTLIAASIIPVLNTSYPPISKLATLHGASSGSATRARTTFYDSARNVQPRQRSLPVQAGRMRQSNSRLGGATAN